MRNKFYSMLPDEFLSACKAKSDIENHLGKIDYYNLKVIVSFIPFLVGAGLGYFLNEFLSPNAALAILTVSGVLAGFVVTMMLFTGKVDGAQSLNLEQAVDYRRKVVYLLWSQITSLGCYLLTIVASILWLAFKEIESLSSGLPFISAVMIGFVSVSLARTFLLPYQIFELHNFSLNSLVEKKKSEESYKVKKIREDLLK